MKCWRLSGRSLWSEFQRHNQILLQICIVLVNEVVFIYKYTWGWGSGQQEGLEGENEHVAFSWVQHEMSTYPRVIFICPPFHLTLICQMLGLFHSEQRSYRFVGLGKTEELLPAIQDLPRISATSKNWRAGCNKKSNTHRNIVFAFFLIQEIFSNQVSPVFSLLP